MSRAWCLALVAIGIIGCGPPTPSTLGPSSSTAASATTGASPATDACTIAQPPGPDDEPPSDTGEMPLTDVGAGRHATCLLGPPGVRIEGTAWCTWTPDRLAVQDVTGLPTAGGPGTIDVYLDFRASAIQISVTDGQGSIATYAQSDVPGAVRDDGSDGLMAFDAPLAADGDPAPPGTPPRQTGTFRWQCAGPPAA